MTEANNIKILIVDDDLVSGNLLTKRLNKKGYACSYVDSGEACLAALKLESYSLILLDIMMPNMSGTDVLKVIREEHNSFELPIIMVTAKDDTSDIVESLNSGANDYITKPINMDIAMARIHTLLQVQSLFEDSLKSKQITTINTMVTTLNHEINNPLAIAVGNLTIAKNKIDEKKIDKALAALDRITQIVKKIEKITSGDMEEVNYSSDVNMFKL